MLSQLFSGIAVLSLIVLLMILLLRRLKQPYFIAYIAAGVLLGPQVFNIIHKPDVISELGEIGIIIMMFSLGSEIDLQDLTRNFYKPLLIAFVQIALSFIGMYFIGSYGGWKMTTIVLTAFIISISSSAIAFQYLARTGEIKSRLGMITCGVLLMQDILVIPMMLALNFMSGAAVSAVQLIKVCAGGTLMVLFLKGAVTKKLFKIPMRKEIAADHELQVFIGFSICFTMAWISGWFGLSTAFGAFASGILIGHDKATRWLGSSLIPFRVFFMAFFFLAVGLQLDIHFFIQNAGTIILISFSVLFINSLINTIVFKLTKNSWRDSLYAGALLSQIGEFSFILMTMAASLKLVENYVYQITLAVITSTMLLTAIWLTIIQQLIYRIK
ncbi:MULTISPECIES: cation:proton antiporter [Flavobacterium]|uniref:cation:proton antiporter domain-containing protein n=1 Tax=Flavobacterium TaxID=237 RepID=UPI002113A6B6|nr:MULTISPECIES: cation:proton antiporter [Flavobacterium]UUF12393.1 cation:proton antiporter [Flavobacterium panici]